MARVRAPAVAGTFYPAAPAALKAGVGSFLAGAPAAQGVTPKAIIAPHAGYVYSGPIAASAYAAVAPLRQTVQRAVLLGPAHYVAVAGLALPGVDNYATPLGAVPVDQEAVARIAHLPQVIESPAAHAREHSLEVQLPFLQAVLRDFLVVPLVVGDASAAQIAEVLELLWGGDETIIVVSSDLSHYLNYAEARAVDEATSQLIQTRGGYLNHHQACGATPINGLLELARRRDLNVRLLDLRNSGDTAGSRDRVVGYGAFGFYAGSIAA